MLLADDSARSSDGAGGGKAIKALMATMASSNTHGDAYVDVDATGGNSWGRGANSTTGDNSGGISNRDSRDVAVTMSVAVPTLVSTLGCQCNGGPRS